MHNGAHTVTAFAPAQSRLRNPSCKRGRNTCPPFSCNPRGTSPRQLFNLFNQSDAPLHLLLRPQSSFGQPTHARPVNSTTRNISSFCSMVIVHVSSPAHTHTHTQSLVYQSWDTCMHALHLASPSHATFKCTKNTGAAHIARHPLVAHAKQRRSSAIPPP